MGLERIDLAQIHGVRRTIAHATGNSASARYCKVSVGVLEDGRFFAERVGATAAGRPGSAAYVFYGEEQAIALADRWLLDGRRWEQVPARWDGQGQPCDGWPWTKVGNQWVMGRRTKPAEDAH